jgi:hypothetical protein
MVLLLFDWASNLSFIKLIEITLWQCNIVRLSAILVFKSWGTKVPILLHVSEKVLLHFRALGLIRTAPLGFMPRRVQMSFWNENPKSMANPTFIHLQRTLQTHPKHTSHQGWVVVSFMYLLLHAPHPKELFLHDCRGQILVLSFCILDEDCWLAVRFVKNTNKHNLNVHQLTQHQYASSCIGCPKDLHSHKKRGPRQQHPCAMQAMQSRVGWLSVLQLSITVTLWSS